MTDRVHERRRAAQLARHYRDQEIRLGTLISRFRRVVKAEPALDALLDETLRRRNFLVHGFFREKAVEISPTPPDGPR